MVEATHHVAKVERKVARKRPTVKKPYKKGGSPEQNEKVHYAWEISKDPDFIYTLEGENGHWNNYRQSDCIKNGVRELSWGFCQIHKPSHPEIYKDERMFTDWKWQMRECWRLYQGGTTFYGKQYISETKHNFEWL